MLSVSDIKSAAAQAACFTCLPINVQQAIKTYLLARVAGASTDPKTIMAAARGFIGLPPGTQLAIQAYAASVLSGAASASDFVKSQACAFQCTPREMALPIAINQLAGRAGVSPVPKSLAALASAFIGLPPGYLSALNTFLMAVIAGISTNAATAAKQAACFTCLPPANLENITTLIWTDVALPRPTGFTLIINPDGSVDIVWDPPPPGVSYTAIYLSFACDYNFVLYANVAAPGTTIHIPGIFGLSPGICIEIRSCSAAGLCSPPVGTGTQGGSPFICPTMIVGAMLLDTMQSYTNGAALNGLNGGTGWCVVSPYVDRTGYLGLQALDTMESYTNGSFLALLNGGTGWSGPYGGDQPVVTLPATKSPFFGGTATFTVTVTGGDGPFTYQWFRNGGALSNTGDFSGVTTVTLSIANYQNFYDGNFVCTVTDSLGRSYSSNICVSTGANAGDVWAAQVVTNGGAAPSAGTKAAINTFAAGLTTDGLDTLMIAVNIIAPDSLIAAFTPLIANSGNLLWTNNNFVAGDLSVNGLTGNGTNKAMKTGVVPNVALVATEGMYAIYAYNRNSKVGGVDMGSFDAVNDANLASNYNNAGFQVLADMYNSGTGRCTAASPGNGFYAMSRTAANAMNVYFASSITPFASIANTAGSGAGINARDIWVFGYNSSGALAEPSNSTISFVAIAHGLTSAQEQNLYNRVQTLRTTLGGGFR